MTYRSRARNWNRADAQYVFPSFGDKTLYMTDARGTMAWLP